MQKCSKATKVNVRYKDMLKIYVQKSIKRPKFQISCCLTNRVHFMHFVIRARTSCRHADTVTLSVFCLQLKCKTQIC